jgi:ribosomal protein S12 methylthiotransferase accessory factor
MRAEAPRQAVVADTGPWAQMCEDLARLLAESLSRQGTVAEVEVAILGTRDEFSVPAIVREPAWPVPVRLYGHHVIVGPFSQDGRISPCPRCLAQRWQAVRSGALRDALELGDQTRSVGAPPWAVEFVADAVAVLIATHLERACSERQGSERGCFPLIYLLDLEGLRISRFPLVPDADCPDCDRRPADNAQDALIVLRSVPKPAQDVFRQRGIDGYDLPLQAFVNPVAGLLGRSVLPDLFSLSTSAARGCFTVRSADYLDECVWGGHAGSYGASVKVGLLEGLERFAGMRARGKRTAVQGSYETFAGHALDPRVCGVYSDEFYRSEPAIRPFAQDREIRWVWGYSLRDLRPVLVPESLAYYHSLGDDDGLVRESSSGCASGGCLEEAVYFGLMEVVERDAFLIAWYGRAELPEIDPRSSSSTETRAMVDRMEMFGYRARFFDTRITFPIPVVTAVAERMDGGLGTLCFGAGASLDPEAALAAGLREIATDAVNLRQRARREQARLRAMADDHEKVLRLDDHPLVYGLPEMAPHAGFLLAGRREPRSLAQAFRTNAIAPGADLRDDVQHCVEAVSRAGFDVIVIDQTTPEQRDVGFHTVKVMVPGLVPIDFGLQRQRALNMPRLRTALREAGLRDRDLRAEDLNSAPHPFP